MTHVHHWKIATVEGTHSPATCECGAEREFANSYDLAMDVKRRRLGKVEGIPGVTFNHLRSCPDCGKSRSSKAHQLCQ